MRLIIDGLTAHTPTWERGIGKTVENLLRQTFFHFRLSEIIVTCFDGSLRTALPDNTGSVRFHYVDQGMMNIPFWERAMRYSAEIERLSVDCKQTVFWHPNPLMLDQILPYYITLPTLVTVYDYIPLRNREMYMSDWPADVVEEYTKRVQFLGSRNVHIATISDTVASQTHEILPLARNVYSIPIGYDQDLMRGSGQLPAAGKRPYVILVTGDDRRKNMVDFVEAFCRAVKDGADICLKVVCAISDKTREKISKVTDAYDCEDRVEVLGFVTDHRLAELVRNASVAAMPSFDEGFGLPVVEAMGCGIPVISSNIPASHEVGGDLVYYFDAADIDDMARVLIACLNDRASGKIDREALIAQARRYSWTEAGMAYRKLLQDIATPEILPPEDKPRVALLTPWPPLRTGIAKCGEILADDLRHWCDLTIVVEDTTDMHASEGAKILDSKLFDETNFDLVICQLGNNTKYHTWIYAHALSSKAIAIVHDTFIHPFLQEGYRNGTLQQHYISMLENHFASDRVRQIAADNFAAVSVFDYTGLSTVAQKAGGILLHNKFGYNAVLREVPGAASRISIAPLALPSEALDISVTKPANDRFVLGMFGFMTRFKLPLEVLAAVQNLTSRGFPIEFRIIGELGDDEDEVLKAIDRYDMQGIVVRVGFAEEAEFMQHIASCDVVINLRHPTLGESSAVVYEAMRLGRPVIVSDNGSFSDLPDDGVVKVTATPHVRDELADKLVELLCDPEKRQAISKKARLYTEEAGSLEQYLRVLRNLIFKVLENQADRSRIFR